MKRGNKKLIIGLYILVEMAQTLADNQGLRKDSRVERRGKDWTGRRGMGGAETTAGVHQILNYVPPSDTG